MEIHNLIEYRDNYSKTSESLQQYYKHEPSDTLTDSESFKSKMKITGNTPADGNTKSAEKIIPLKYFNKFWRSLEVSLVICEVNLILIWPSTCDTKLYVLVVTLAT